MTTRRRIGVEHVPRARTMVAGAWSCAGEVSACIVIARGEPCADRRAWTWEGRFTEPLDFVDVQVAHHAGHMAREVIERFDTRARALPLMTAAGGEALYRASGPLLEELTQ